MTMPSQVLDIARSQIGVVEQPPNSNRTPFTAWYGLVGPWCAMFVSWCFYKAGLPLPASTAKGFAYCPSGIDWFKARGRWTTTPKPGYVVFFHWPGGRDSAQHVGIVESVNADGSINTIEGNTDVAGGGSGGRVMRQVRRGNIVGYGVPDYASQPNPAPTTPASPVWTNPVPQVTLKAGDQGKNVTVWQYLLVALAGQKIVADGVFGPATVQATKNFQLWFHLTADGIVGPQTRAQMAAIAASKR